MKKRKMFKSGMALMSAAIVMAGSVPMTMINTFAVENSNSITAVQADNQITSGKWGTCDWKFEDGILTIGGGEGLPTCKTILDKWDWECTPWELLNSQIKSVVITGNIKIKETATWATLENFFGNMVNLENIEGLDYIDFSNVSKLSYMFYNCKSLKKIDLSGLNTANLFDMQYMFYGCEQLENIDFTGFNTSRVKNMSGMFNFCKNLSDVNLDSFDTSNVIYMSWMFGDCSNLERLDISSFDTSKVASMPCMFIGCSNLEMLDLSNFDTSKVTNMSSMFQGCSNLEKLDLSNFNTSNVRDMSSMFTSCYNLKELNLSNFDTSKVTNMFQMFQSCSLENMNIGNFDMSRVTNIDNMFATGQRSYCIEIPKSLGNIKDSFIEMIRNIFPDSIGIVDETNGKVYEDKTTVVIEEGHVYKPVSSGKWGTCNWNWNEDSKILTIDGGNATAVVTSKNIPWGGISKYINKINIIGDISFENSEDSLRRLFGSCFELKEIVGFERIDTHNIKNFFMLFYASGLEKVNLSRLDTSKAESMIRMFGMTDIKELDLSSFDTSNVVYMQYMFEYCSELEKLDMSSFDISNVSDKGFTSMIIGCDKLREIITPRTMGNNKGAFSQSIIGNMISGPWTDVTAGIRYDDKPDVLEEGHRYVQGDVEIPAKVSDIIKNNNLNYQIKTESDSTQLLTGIKPDTEAAQMKQNFGGNIVIKNVEGKEISDTEKMATGYTIEVVQNGVVTDTVTVVIKGDTDGNSAIDVLDMETIQKSILGIGDKLSGAYKEAATLTEDSADITVLDMEAIQKDILGIQKIN